MTDKEKILNEINRKFSEIKDSPKESDSGLFYYLKELANFINSLQEEPKSYDLVKFADWQSIECRNQREKSGIKDPVMLDEIENAAYGGIMNGAKWQKEQMLQNAIDATVKVDAGGYPYIHRTIELYNYDKDEPLAKAGDKVKILVIKDK